MGKNAERNQSKNVKRFHDNNVHQSTNVKFANNPSMADKTNMEYISNSFFKYIQLMIFIFCLELNKIKKTLCFKRISFHFCLMTIMEYTIPSRTLSQAWNVF